MRVRVLVAALGWAALAAPAHGADTEAHEAWFHSRGEGATWCAFVTEASARAAEEDELNDWGEIGWVQYRESRIETVRVMLQSEDAYVEDTYSFAPDLSIERLVRNGHYFEDPFVRASFEPDGAHGLKMTGESRKAVADWNEAGHATYFFEWPLYSSFADIPFSGLIKTTPAVSVWETCTDQAAKP